MTTQHAHLPSDIPLESVDPSGFSLGRSRIVVDFDNSILHTSYTA